jgi:hypothetical protein
MTKPVLMIALAEMQRNFISDCLSDRVATDNTLLTKNIDSRLISAQGLIGIYKNSAKANIIYSLSLTYPVIEKLVGDDFFRMACHHFIIEHWPKSGNMDDYGAEFSDFIAIFEHAKHLIYLKDVARLEWAFHQSSLAIEPHKTDWSTLAQVQDVLQLEFVLTPSHQFIRSTFPIDKIWQANQNNSSSDLNVDFSCDDNGVGKDIFLIVYRQKLKTKILRVTYGEFALLESFKNERKFEQAIYAATEKQVDFSVDVSLKKFIELGVISSFINKK